MSSSSSSEVTRGQICVQGAEEYISVEVAWIVEELSGALGAGSNHALIVQPEEDSVLSGV